MPAIACDLCEQENAVVMQTNLVDGSSLAVGGNCAVQFFGGALLGLIGSDQHAGPPTKCQACRRVHEHMTTPVAPLSIPAPDTAGQGEPALAGGDLSGVAPADLVQYEQDDRGDQAAAGGGE